METTTIKKTRNWWDLSGIFFSGLCLIHCIAPPILLASTSLWITSEWVHTAFLVILIPIAVFASRRALRPPRKLWIVIMLHAGLVFLGLGIVLGHDMGEAVEIGLTIIGSVMLIVSHIANSHRHF